MESAIDQPEQQPQQPEEEQKTPEQLAKEKALAEQRRIQEEFDRKNAAGAVKELKKSEIVDWRNHETLNNVTKMAISYFEQGYSLSDYIDERNEKESNIKGSNKQSGSNVPKDKLALDGGSGGDDSDMDDDDEEEEEEDAVSNWDRAEAERMYSGTRGTLQEIYE